MWKQLPWQRHGPSGDQHMAQAASALLAKICIPRRPRTMLHHVLQ